MPQGNTRMIAIDKLQYDIKNPRIARLIERFGPEPSAEQVSLALGAGTPSSQETVATTFASLKESIRTNGGIITPIIVNEKDGSYIVIEGNTRLSIYREFDQQNVPGNWKSILCLVYKQLDNAGVDAIRLQAHLVGPRPWDPYSKAKYLNYLRNCEYLTMNQVIDFCGGRKQEVNNYIQAYNDMENFYRPILDDPNDFDPTRFSAFVELQKPIIKQAISNAGFSLKDFSTWVDKRLIDPLATVRDLPAILSKTKSKDKFLKDGAREALKELDKGDTSDLQSVPIEQIVKELSRRLRLITLDAVKRMADEPDSENTRDLFNLSDEIHETCKSIEKMRAD